MDYQLIALIAMMVATVAVGVTLRPRSEYHRVFSASAAGLLFLLAGLIGWDLSRSHGLFQGTRWVDGPVWWQGLGIGLLALAAFWARRLPPRPGGDSAHQASIRTARGSTLTR